MGRDEAQFFKLKKIPIQLPPLNSPLLPPILFHFIKENLK